MEPQNINEQNNSNQNQQIPTQSNQVLAPIAEDPGKTLGIVGLVLAFLFPLAGIIVCAIARSKSKKSGFNNQLALGGLITSIVFFILSFIVSIGIIFGIVSTLNGGFVVGNWNQTGSGLTFDGAVSKTGADYVQIKSDKNITWYSDSSDKSKNYTVGTYKIELGNKSNDEGQIEVGDYTVYTLTFKVDKYVDENGNQQKISKDLVYLVYYNSDDSKSFNAISVDSLRGYKFTKE
ncbi:MAG: DUF4190 domain-containing protein [Candidatus Saccharibacteria bacterium]